MATLRFQLSPESTGRVYDALICLSRFGEHVSLEARSDKLTLTALNLTRTAYASFALDAKTFFIEYDCVPASFSSSAGGDRFTCQILNKALLSTFKGRASDSRGRDTAVELCTVSIQDQPDRAECRLIVDFMCKNGMNKTYRLTYESIEIMHALFDKAAATQGWRISSRVLREYSEYFGPKTDQLDLLAQEGKAIFTSFTEKIQDGKQVLKQPVETAVSIHTEDFEDFHVQENMHVVISVTDFKAIVVHACTLRTAVSAQFSLPTRPLQFFYSNFGMLCEFTLMTTGDLRGASSTPNPRYITTRSSFRQPSVVTPPSTNHETASREMPPPARPTATQSFANAKGKSSLASLQKRQSADDDDPDPQSLFVPEGDGDEHRWDPPSYNNEEEEETLGWDANNEHPSAGFHQTFRNTGTPAHQAVPQRAAAPVSQDGLEPTQRLSQLHGMFD